MGLWFDFRWECSSFFKELFFSVVGQRVVDRGWCWFVYQSFSGYGRQVATGRAVGGRWTERWCQHRCVGSGDDKPQSLFRTHRWGQGELSQSQCRLLLCRPRLLWPRQAGPGWLGTTCGDVHPGPAVVSRVPMWRPQHVLLRQGWDLKEVIHPLTGVGCRLSEIGDHLLQLGKIFESRLDPIESVTQDRLEHLLYIGFHSKTDTRQ